jgi:hypothetical protein
LLAVLTIVALDSEIATNVVAAMPPTVDSRKIRTDSLALLGGLIMLLDTAWGGMILLGLDLSRTNELVMGTSFVLGFPTYLLDVWIKRRVAVSLLGLFLFRWVARCYGGSSPVLCNPLPGSMLLVLALIVLQLSKLRRPGSA